MGYNVDLFDRKILYELDIDSTISLAKLAHKIKRSKQFVLYRMRKLEEAGVITGYHAIVDMSKLGYFTFRVYFKFQQTTEKGGDKFVDYVKKNLSQVWTITSMHGRWDYALFLGVKNIAEFHFIWDEIMLKYKEKIKAYNVAVYAPIYNFNRKFFLDDPRGSVERVYGIGDKDESSDKDWELIKIYANDVRQSYLEISRKLKVSPETVRNKIRNLEKNKIIAGYKIGLDLEKLDHVGYRVDLQLISTKKNKEIFEYCKQHKNIYQINKSIGGADFETEVIVRDLPHLRELIDELKKRFSDVINDVDYFGFSTFHLLKYIPD